MKVQNILVITGEVQNIQVITDENPKYPSYHRRKSKISRITQKKRNSDSIISKFCQNSFGFGVLFIEAAMRGIFL